MTNPDANAGWTMFSTSKEEVSALLVSMGALTIGSDFLKVENYPFEPSRVFRQPVLPASHIDEISLKSCPPAIRVRDELIFLRSDRRAELELFAHNNNIKVVERATIWEWILEPFLDTEYTEDTDQRLTELLNRYGLDAERVSALRAEVKTQMLKYNFDTMLWEWVALGASDVLRAMRTKYNQEAFAVFYRKVMRIALQREC